MKWLLISFILGATGVIAVFLVEDFSRVNGEMNRSILFTSTIVIFILNLSSLFSLVIANSKRILSQIVISAFTILIPLFGLALNGFLFTVYFFGK